MKTCKRPLGRGADDGTAVRGSSCDKERGALVEPRTVRLVVLGRSRCGCRYRSYHQYSFLKFAAFVLESVRRGSACHSIYYGLV